MPTARPRRCTGVAAAPASAEGSELPAGYRWDPWGNRPLASNCSRDGWVPVVHPRHGEDCVREGTDLPEGWRRVTEG